MTVVVALFGVLITILCLAGLVSPAALRKMFSHLSEQTTWVLAVVVRLAFGTLLLIVADDLRHSFAMTILGWIAIVAAVVVLLIGPERLNRLVRWWLEKLPDSVLRASMVFAIAFGVFFVYVAV
jgi:hypothetical protein